MKYYLNYGKERLYSHLPKGWNLISYEDRLALLGLENPLEEIRNSTDHPIGHQRLSLLRGL